MAIIAQNIVQDVKVLLNDPIGSIYPDLALLPYVQKAYKELQTKLAAHGVSTTKDAVFNIILNPGVTLLGDGAGLPTDFIYPIELREREVGSTGAFTRMQETEWEPDAKPGGTLNVWSFREETIKFVGATTPREIMLRYMKTLPPLNNLTDNILINDSALYIAQRAAALAALLIGSNPARSSAIMQDLNAADGPWSDLKATKIKPMQNIPVRRRRTRYRRHP